MSSSDGGFMEKNKEIALYKSKDGKIELKVKLEEETVWVTQKQLTDLFEIKKHTVSYHLKEIFNSKELLEKSVVRKIRTTASDGKTYAVNYYNLDIVISIGYRVNSRKATEFRIWATNVLKQFLVNGYAINEQRLKAKESKIKELYDTVKLLSHIMSQKELESDEAVGLLKVITDYTLALDLLDRYDHETVEIEKAKISTKKVKELTYKDAVDVVRELAKRFSSSNVFAKEKDSSFRGSIEDIYQTFDGKDLYPSIEEKAANLLYFLVKNHSFIDGNKRIAASIFLHFMNKNGILYKKDGSRILNDNALVATTLMIAESRPEHKSVMVKMLVNLIDRKN